MHMVDYRKFRFSKLNTPEFSHLKLLIFWPVFGILFALLEKRSDDIFYAVECGFDELIPFCEYFIIPYYFWFVFMIGMILYTLLFDVESFRKCMYFIIATYTVTLIIYIIFPTSQELRPTEFTSDNFFIRVVKWMYDFDTNTNVCPSIHVLGSMAVFLTAWNSRQFSTTGWRLAFGIANVLICVSTVFLKQHSIIDVIAALALCTIVCPLVFSKKAESRAKEKIHKVH